VAADTQPKAVRQGYEPSAFFFTQRHDSGDSRLLAWAPSLVTLRYTIERLIKVLPASVEVLLKIQPDGESSAPSDDQIWERFYGVVPQEALLEAIARCDVFIFQDSRNQLCVRDPTSFDYIVLDNVGVIYVYSDAAAFRHVLVDAGFEERMEQLVSEARRTGRKHRRMAASSSGSLCASFAYLQCPDRTNREILVRFTSPRAV
jgi:hypothetical protein